MIKSIMPNYIKEKYLFSDVNVTSHRLWTDWNLKVKNITIYDLKVNYEGCKVSLLENYTNKIYVQLNQVSLISSFEGSIQSSYFETHG